MRKKQSDKDLQLHMLQTYRAFLHGKISVIRTVILCVWFSLVSLYPGNVYYRRNGYAKDNST